MQGRVHHTYLEHLAYFFPTFAKWLHDHMHILLEEEILQIPEEVIALYCHPCNVALSFGAMWAYGYHYRCAPNLGSSSHVAYDCSIAVVSEDIFALDVGV